MKKVLKVFGLFVALLFALALVSMISWPLLIISGLAIVYFAKIEPNDEYLGYAKKGLAIGVVGVVISIFSGDGGAEQEEVVDKENEVERVVAEEPVEEKEIYLLDGEKEILTLSYESMTDSERKRAMEIVSQINEYSNEDKELISENKDRLSGEKKAFDESERLARKEERESSERKTNYENFINSTSSQIGSLFVSLSTQVSAIEYTDTWVLKTSGIVFQITEVADEIIEYDEEEVPEEYSAVHSEYVKGAKKYKESMELFVKGFDSMDANVIEESANSMNQGNEHIDEATRLILEIVDENNEI